MINKNKIFKKNLSYGLIYKVLTILLIYLTIPLLIKYLGTEYYGVWLTIFTMVNMVFYFDAGLGFGLKNKLTEALAIKDKKSATEFISTAYFSILFFAIIILCLGLLVIYMLDLAVILNTDIDEFHLKMIVYITLVLIVIGFVLNIYKQLFYAIQNSAMVELALLVYQTSIIIQILILYFFFKRDLIFIPIVYGISNILTAIVFSYWFFKKEGIRFPSIKYLKKNKIKDIMGIGIEFFIIQLCLVVILSTDNIIISYLLGPEEVTSYQIVFKIFQIFLVFATIVLTPLWTLYTDAFIKKDYKWIKNTLLKLNKYFIALTFFVLIMVFIIDWIVELWIPEQIIYSQTLVIFMGIFVLIKVFGDIYMYFLNGIGEIKLQLILMVVGAIINIPLSVLFVVYFKLGSSGVILATIISLTSLAVFMPIQVKSILRKELKTKKP